MKKIIYLFVITFSIQRANAQPEHWVEDTAIDFTLTDIKGNTHNLYSILASGKYVCLDLFFLGCTPCVEKLPYFHQAYLNYGCNNHDVFFMALSYDDSNFSLEYNDTIIFGPSGSGFPIISGIEGGIGAGDMAYNYTWSGFPTNVLIAPDRSILMYNALSDGFISSGSDRDMKIESASSFDYYFSNHGIIQKPCLTTSILEKKSGGEFGFFPNPAINSLKVSFNELGSKTISLIDSQGKSLITSQTEETQVELNTESLNNGLYFLRVKSGRGERTEKVIVQHEE